VQLTEVGPQNAPPLAAVPSQHGPGTTALRFQELKILGPKQPFHHPVGIDRNRIEPFEIALGCARAAPETQQSDGNNSQQAG
jgi:hypothetical protein